MRPLARHARADQHVLAAAARRPILGGREQVTPDRRALRAASSTTRPMTWAVSGATSVRFSSTWIQPIGRSAAALATSTAAWSLAATADSRSASSSALTG